MLWVIQNFKRERGSSNKDTFFRTTKKLIGELPLLFIHIETVALFLLALSLQRHARFFIRGNDTACLRPRLGLVLTGIGEKGHFSLKYPFLNVITNGAKDLSPHLLAPRTRFNVGGSKSMIHNFAQYTLKASS